MSRYVTLPDLEAVLEQLTEQRAGSLRLLLSAPLYEAMLVRLLERIRGLSPRRRRGPRPLTEELKQADALHDGLGTAVWHLLAAYRAHPRLDAALRAQAASLMETFIAERVELQGTYLDEGLNARGRAPLLEEHRQALERFPVVGGTLEVWVREFVEAGLQLHALLQRRAELEGELVRDPAAAMALRSEVVGVLGRLRGVLRDELNERPELPRDLEGRLFAYYDLVTALRRQQAASRGEAG